MNRARNHIGSDMISANKLKCKENQLTSKNQSECVAHFSFWHLHTSCKTLTAITIENIDAANRIKIKMAQNIVRKHGRLSMVSTKCRSGFSIKFSWAKTITNSIIPKKRVMAAKVSPVRSDLWFGRGRQMIDYKWYQTTKHRIINGTLTWAVWYSKRLA